jgi:OOP family OmpA-OmpF porin
MFRQFRPSLIAVVSLGFAAHAYAADVPGSKDPPGFKRYEGSEIIHYVSRNYDQYIMAREDGSFDKSERVEGALTRIIYLVPDGHTSLEIFRNYEKMLADIGFTRTFEMASGNISKGDYFFDPFYFQAENDSRRAHEGEPFRGSRNPYYVTEQATKDGQDIAVTVLVAEASYEKWEEPGVKTPFPIKPQQVLVAVDVVTSKSIAINMVEVKASDIADALATKGSVDLYGIYFDVDKTEIKPESGKTLDEVASLLKIDRSLKLEISGHTDNSGGADHNLKLSEGRAQAVVDALVKKYGIDAARLTAKGYGDTKPVAPNDDDAGKAKNRRVELRKI